MNRARWCSGSIASGALAVTCGLAPMLLLVTGFASAASAADPNGANLDRVVAKVAIPAVTLTDQDGHSHDLLQLLGDPHPVVLTFIFTSCRSVCPALTSAVFGIRKQLHSVPDTRYVSISIDPEFDTPDVLRRYAARFDASSAPNWSFLTGTLDDIVAVQRAFDIYAGDKNSHRPVIFVKPRATHTWTRFDSSVPIATVAAELRDHSRHNGDR